ncbi:MAG: alcohol dehydrogenase catalytic domain-containing protein [Erysipelothrix sp.]|nr:alcohol dehydrogenase catalytic domain-containing protein [Erysipelothrix sp.]
MDAIVLLNKHEIAHMKVKTPELTNNAVKVKISYCGICGTDVHKYNGISGARPLTYPVILGHEVSGVVEDIGKDVTLFKKGDRVVVDPNWHCKACEYCKVGLIHLCDNSKGVVKGMATYICPPEENVYKIPDHLSLKDASLAEPLSCCLRAVELSNIKPYDNVLIIGFGAIGALMTSLLRSYNCKIIVTDIDDTKKELAEQLGVTFVNTAKENLKDLLKEKDITHLHSVIECVGLPSTMEDAINISTKGTRVILFGVADANATVSFNPYQAFLKEISIHTSYINPYTMQKAIDILASGNINTEDIISTVIEMKDVKEELATLKNVRKGKVLVSID